MICFKGNEYEGEVTKIMQTSNDTIICEQFVSIIENKHNSLSWLFSWFRIIMKS